MIVNKNCKFFKKVGWVILVNKIPYWVCNFKYIKNHSIRRKKRLFFINLIIRKNTCFILKNKNILIKKYHKQLIMNKLKQNPNQYLMKFGFKNLIITNYLFGIQK